MWLVSFRRTTDTECVQTDVEKKSLRVRAPELARCLALVRKAAGLAALHTGLAMAFSVLVLWLAITMPLDWMMELPRWARVLFLVAGVGGAAVVAWWWGVRGWLHRPSDEAVALRIEAALPEFRSRLIASVQLSREDDGSLVRALVLETATLARSSSLRGVVSRARFVQWAKVGAGLFVCAVVAWLLAGKASWPLFQRAVLVEAAVPRRTQIVESTGSKVMAMGDDLRIAATVASVIPAGGKLHIVTESGKRQEFAFDPTAPNAATFARNLQSVQESFSYTLELGDNRTQSAQVKVRPRPTVGKVEAAQIWPEYTGLPPKPRMMNDLRLLAGSKLNLRLQSPARLKSATVRLVAADQKTIVREVPMQAGEMWNIIADVPANAAGLSFRLVDEEGIESKASVIHRLEILPDEQPTVCILWPVRREELVTRNATFLVSFEAKDDFGVERVRLHYGVNWTSGTPHKMLDLNLDGETPKSVTRRFEWRIERLALSEGDTVEFWLEVLDGNTVTGPGTGVLAEHYQVRVVSEAEKRADLASRLDDTLRGLNDVKTGQEELSKRLGEMIQVRPQ